MDFFPVSIPGKRRVKALLFLWGKKGIGGYWIPAFAGMTERGDTGMTRERDTGMTVRGYGDDEREGHGNDRK